MVTCPASCSPRTPTPEPQGLAETRTSQDHPWDPPSPLTRPLQLGVGTGLVLASGLGGEVTERGLRESAREPPAFYSPLPALHPTPGQSPTAVVSHKMKAHGGPESLQGEQLTRGVAWLRE